jgi:hypothetical protein
MKAFAGCLALAALAAFDARAQEAQVPPPSADPTIAAEAEAPVDAPAAPAERGAPMDHLELDPTSITGNRELPKVMVIVPWKRAELGELEGKPANSLLNEVLEPVDRDVFRREIRYFDALAAKPET